MNIQSYLVSMISIQHIYKHPKVTHATYLNLNLDKHQGTQLSQKVHLKNELNLDRASFDIID